MQKLNPKKVKIALYASFYFTWSPRDDDNHDIYHTIYNNNI